MSLDEPVHESPAEPAVEAAVEPEGSRNGRHVDGKLDTRLAELDAIAWNIPRPKTLRRPSEPVRPPDDATA